MLDETSGCFDSLCNVLLNVLQYVTPLSVRLRAAVAELMLHLLTRNLAGRMSTRPLLSLFGNNWPLVGEWSF